MPTWRRIISSVTILAVASAVGWGGIQCCRAGLNSGVGVVMIIGVAILLVAMAIALVTVAPIELVEKVFGPHSPPNDTVSDGSESLWSRRWFDLFMWW